MGHIRNLAICVFRDRDRILAAPGRDDVTNERFYRPLGGAVEFGELAEDALRREIREELGLEIADVVHLGVLENRFVYQGQPGHEIVFVFDAAFVDRRVYAEPTVALREAGRDGPAEWLVASAPRAQPLHPAGLAALLAGLPSAGGSAEREVRDTAAAWDRAMVGNDPEAIGAFMADDWRIVGPDGSVNDRKRFLSLVASGDLTHDVMETHEMEVTLHGDTAVVVARGVSGGSYRGESFLLEERYSSVFAKRDGRWRCVLTHLSPLASTGS